MTTAPRRPRSTWITVLLLWVAFYASFTLFMPQLLDDADSVHVEVAREMLLRHDYVTLYANGIRYLEKAPLLYWSMAASMKVAMVFGAQSGRALAAAARVPLALAVLALVLVVEAFARRMFHSTRAGLYAALVLLSCPGIFLFTRITIPDVAVCLWSALALYCFWRTEELGHAELYPEHHRAAHSNHLRLYCGGFAVACALNVLTKGLIGVVFPVGIVAIYMVMTMGWRRSGERVRHLHPWATLEAFVLIAAPWHILAGLANPGEGHPAAFRWLHGHWLVPLPTNGNVRGWYWFYFMNEHVLRYLNLRIPHDYDTSPLWLFWGLCLVWLLPWSAFGFKATGWAFPLRAQKWSSQFRRHDLPLKRRGVVLLGVWAAFVLLFFAFSTRQEYYVLPALPAVAILIAGWLAFYAPSAEEEEKHRRAARRCVAVLLVLGTVFAAACVYLLLHGARAVPGVPLAQLIDQHPKDYALSMGHFLDLDTRALGLFHIPLVLAALSLFGGPLVALLLLRRSSKAQPAIHAATLALAVGAFGFLLAADLGLQTFAPVLSSAQLAEAIAPQVQPQDMVAIHGEYESGSTLGFYLRRNDIHILEGRSSNLWYGSFFSDAPPIFETPQSMAERWASPQRVFLWQSVTDSDAPRTLPPLPGKVYVLARSGGKEIISNKPDGYKDADVWTDK